MIAASSLTLWEKKKARFESLNPGRMLSIGPNPWPLVPEPHQRRTAVMVTAVTARRPCLSVPSADVSD